MPAILVDTNVLVYSYDSRDPAKKQRAIEVLNQLQHSPSSYLSAQTLAEFMNATRKLKITPADAQKYVGWFVETWRIIDLTPAIILEAARGVRDHSLAYYDAQIWATAKLNQIPVLFSEDFNPGVTLEGVRFVNPFAESFKLDDWV
jgi:predicted nucleic acid-binding protein